MAKSLNVLRRTLYGALSMPALARAPKTFPGYNSIMKPIYSDHTRLDERSLALHRFIAGKIRANPALLDKARANLRRWQESDDSPSLAFAEWAQILTGPVDQVAQFLVERSERALRLRQSSPFCGILTEAERRAVYESHSTRTYHPRREQHCG